MSQTRFGHFIPTRGMHYLMIGNVVINALALVLHMANLLVFHNFWVSGFGLLCFAGSFAIMWRDNNYRDTLGRWWNRKRPTLSGYLDSSRFPAYANARRLRPFEDEYIAQNGGMIRMEISSLVSYDVNLATNQGFTAWFANDAALVAFRLRYSDEIEFIDPIKEAREKSEAIG